jgi:hypothetical protein
MPRKHSPVNPSERSGLSISLPIEVIHLFAARLVAARRVVALAKEDASKKAISSEMVDALLEYDRVEKVWEEQNG